MQDGLPDLDDLWECGSEVIEVISCDMRGLETWMSRKDFDKIVAPLIATRAELRDLKLAASLACELHGCASAECTMAQYHEDVQKLFADLAAKDAELIATRAESAEWEQQYRASEKERAEVHERLTAEIANLTKAA